MNNKLICPFCQQEYIITKDDSCFGQQRCVCRNPNCEFDGWHFPVKLVSELIRTRKALENARESVLAFRKRTDIAMCALAEISKQHPDGCNKLWYVGVARKALEQITALKQKD